MSSQVSLKTPWLCHQQNLKLASWGYDAGRVLLCVWDACPTGLFNTSQLYNVFNLSKFSRKDAQGPGLMGTEGTGVGLEVQVQTTSSNCLLRRTHHLTSIESSGHLWGFPPPLSLLFSFIKQRPAGRERGLFLSRFLNTD